MKGAAPVLLRSAAFLVLAGCTPDAPSSEPKPAARVPIAAAAPTSLEGRWRILSIDGQPPAGKATEGERAPHLTFSGHSFGGSVGCNTGGGLGFIVDGHFAMHSWASTAIGCHGEMGRQESALSRLFFARPAITPLGNDRVRIHSADHQLELQRTGPADSPPIGSAPVELAGTSWRIVMMDGQEDSTSPTGRILRFGNGTWQGLASCATLSGTWRREGDRIRVGEQIATTEQNCPPEFARIDAAFADLMRSNPRYLVGPNGELLMAGKGHALTGGRAD